MNDQRAVERALADAFEKTDKLEAPLNERLERYLTESRLDLAFARAYPYIAAAAVTWCPSSPRSAVSVFTFTAHNISSPL